jgi:tetratricopeptide (TPR) repeat protein
MFIVYVGKLTNLGKSARLFFPIILFLSSIVPAYGETLSVQQSFTYTASPIDTKASSQTIASRNLKRLLLDKLAAQLEAAPDGGNLHLNAKLIGTLLAGLVIFRTSDEKWNGKVYSLLGQISADQDRLIKALDTLSKDYQGVKELEKARRKTEELLNDLDKLRKEDRTHRSSKRRADAARARRAKSYEETIAKVKGVDWYESAFAAQQAGDNQGAIRAYTRSLELIPNYAEALFRRGAAFAVGGEHEKARRDFDRALDLNPEYTIAYMFRGVASYRLKKYERAIQDFNKAIDMNPKYVEAYLIRGAAQHRLKNYQQAIRDFTKVAELNPGYAEAYYLRGNVYFSSGDFKHAIEDQSKAIELKPNYGLAHFSRGTAYYNLRNFEQAIGDFTKTIELNPDYGEAYAIRGATHGSLGNIQQANEDLKKAAKLGDKEAQSFLTSKGIKWE